MHLLIGSELETSHDLLEQPDHKDTRAPGKIKHYILKSQSHISTSGSSKWMTKLKLLIFMLILRMKSHASCEPDLNQHFNCQLKRKWVNSLLSLNIPFRNPLDALLRRMGFKSFRLQVCLVFKKELQHMNVNKLWQCMECVHNNSHHFWHLL